MAEQEARGTRSPDLRVGCHTGSPDSHMAILLEKTGGRQIDQVGVCAGQRQFGSLSPSLELRLFEKDLRNSENTLFLI